MSNGSNSSPDREVAPQVTKDRFSILSYPSIVVLHVSSKLTKILDIKDI